MEFVPLPIAEAEGLILGHNVAGSGGRRLLRKGKALSAKDIAVLRTLGREVVYVARLAAEDVVEDLAAQRVAEPFAQPGIRLSRPGTGRVNLYAEVRGLLRVDRGLLLELNALDGVTLATLRDHAAVRPGKMVATLKIIPYALPESTVQRAERIAAGGVLRFSELRESRVDLILSGSPGARERIIQGFEGALVPRLEALGARLERGEFIPLEDPADEERLAEAIHARCEAGTDLLILAGETAIMDRFDIAPRAVERAGGDIVCFGAPVDPGNLLLLAYRRQTPILGAPGCARSPKKNIVDLVLPRLLAGDRLTRREIAAFGHGGLLEDVPERPLPRSWLT